IGPDPLSIDLLGNKSKAKETMKSVDVPTIPGSDGVVTDETHALTLAKEMGYPALLKASAGGGGRGIRIVHNDQQLIEGYHSAKAEAKACFGDDDLYLEKFLTGTRHIEFQILADNFGHVIHLGERDCSMQRRNQKVLEEAPSTALNPVLRKKMGDAAVKAAKAVGYKNTGTVEFLLDDQENFYFMEMNTRIQVEHPVTEMITGIDLIKQQLIIAAGQPLTYKQKDIDQDGHSIECRINAESPKHNFRPASGTVDYLHVPGGLGVRFDSALYQGYKVPSHYDSMLGKLIVHGTDRAEAIARMKNALHELAVEGIETNIEFQLQLLNHPDFVAGNYDTRFIDEKLVMSNAN
ncbi:MAG: ATP-grasp domain-containing protein, partial [Hyphomonadaceae bacterium]|nr:ATP-grasp domain-containing protein [Clostridia bacterium]